MQVCRRARAAIAVVIAAAVGGCVAEGGGVVRGGGASAEVPVTEAFISPPPGGPAVIAVLENRYRNGLAQDIVLENSASNAGENAILVRAYGPMGRDAGIGELPGDTPALGDVRAELARLFPGVRMELSGLYVQNKYGPFSYATGRSRTGANCVFAFQRIAAKEKVFALQRGAITWRLRLCDNRADPRSLLLVAYGLTIQGYFLSRSWNPYAVPEPDPRIGAPGVAILPEQVVDPTVVAPTSFGASAAAGGASGGARRPTRRRAAPAAARQVAAPPVVLNRPVEGAAIVPRPEGTDLSEPVPERSNLPQSGTAAAPTPRRGPVPPPPPAQGARTPALPQATAPRVPSVRLVQPN